MSPGTTGTQSQPTHEQSPPVNGNQTHPSHPDPESQELTHDPPPQAPTEGEGKAKRPRGFAAMDRKLVSEIARKGGKAAHSAGTAHEFTSEEARVAGRKGGRATHAKRRKLVERPEVRPPEPQEEETATQENQGE
jgi:general stress protein YciG